MSASALINVKAIDAVAVPPACRTSVQRYLSIGTLFANKERTTPLLRKTASSDDFAKRSVNRVHAARLRHLVCFTIFDCKSESRVEYHLLPLVAHTVVRPPVNRSPKQSAARCAYVVEYARHR